MSHFITEHRNFVEVTRLPADVKNDLLKETSKDIKILINRQNFLMDDPNKGELVKICMDIYIVKSNLMEVFTIEI